MQIGPFSVERELGRGGMGAVYLGREPGGAHVAIKVIHADLSLDEDFAARFEREGAALERLAHPNLVALRRRGTYRGGHWLAMDYVPGGSLEERLKLQGPWPSHAARELLISLCEGISHAHQAGILHRDLKPANVLLRAQDGQALIADFGLALPLDVSQHLTRTGEILGSPGYLAPEQCGLDQPTTPATDVYGLGALLYFVLSGQPPLTGASLLAMLDNVLNQPPPPLSGLVENLDPRLEAICLRCLAKDPSERYQSARELQDALQEEPAPPAQPRRRALWAALASLAALALVSAAWLGRPPDLESAASSPPEPTPAPVTVPTAAPTAAPTPVTGPTAAPSPAPAATAFERALARRDWARARALLAPVTGDEGAWLRYRFLEARIDWTGAETPEWRQLKLEAAQQAKASAASGGSVRLRQGLLAALDLLGDPRLGELEAKGAQRLLQDLEAALQVAKSPKRRAALWRAVVEIQLAYANPKEPALFAALRSWEREGGKTWRSQLALGQAAQKAGNRQLQLRALRDGERASYQADHPWARYEFYLLRAQAAGQPTRNGAFLAQAILGSAEAPATLKAECALTLASYLITDGGDPARAAEVLKAAPPSQEAPERTRAAFWQARAAASLAAGDARSIRSLLEQPRRSSAPVSVYSEQLLRACAHALLQEPRLAREALQLAHRPPRVVPFVVILELQTAILTGSHERALQAAREVVGFGGLVMPLRALVALEAMLALETPEGRPLVSDLRPARQAGAVINAALLPKRDLNARALIQVGRWEAAIELTLRLHHPSSPPAEDERVFRICHQALARGLAESPPSSAEWKGAQRLVSSFASRARSSQPKRVLLALLESLEDVSPVRRSELVTILEQAARTGPLWEELLAAVVRLHKRSLMEFDPPTRFARRAALARSTRAWSEAFPSSPEASLEYVAQLPKPQLNRQLRALASQTPTASPHWWRVQTNLLLAQFFAGELNQEAFYLDYVGVLSSNRDPLRRERRKSLLLLAEGRGVKAEPLEAQRLLDWLVATTGPLEPCDDPVDRVTRARYLHLRARLALSRGDAEGALAIRRELTPYPSLVPPLSRAHSEALYAEAELQLERPGLDRLRAALEETPFREGFLTLARHASGEDERREAFERALAYLGTPRQVEELLREVEACDMDPAAMLQRGLAVLEEIPETRPLAYAKTLYLQRPGAERALLLYQALRIERNRAPAHTKIFRQESGPLLAEALTRLTPEARALLQALDALDEALRGSQAVEIRAALSELRKVPAPVSLADRLRAPIAIAEALQHPAMSRGDPGALEGAERELNAYLERGTAPLGLWTWFAEVCRNRGEAERAREEIDGVLERLSRAPQAARARFLFQAALNACALGEDDQALKLLRETLEATEMRLTVAAASLAEAQVRVRRGELRAAERALMVAHEFCPSDLPILQIQVTLVVGRIQVEDGHLVTARESLRSAKSHEAYGSAPAGVRCFGEALEAALLNAEGAHERALTLSEAALALNKREPFAHLTRLSALVGLGKADEAKREARALLEGSDLNPGPKAEVAAWLEQAGE